MRKDTSRKRGRVARRTRWVAVALTWFMLVYVVNIWVVIASYEAALRASAL